MTTIVRHCTSCGRDDLSRRWSSRDAAADDGALRGAWACPNCAWTEAELAEAAPADASPASTSTKPLSGSAQPQSEDRDPALDTGDPEKPVDPDEMRRSVETEARILR
ncbi:MAG TPA: hypothetical protein VF323_09130 [Candidatus Limnocylindrales bacterium]